MLTLYLILVSTNTLLGAIPLIETKKKIVNWAFFFTTFGLSIWTIANYMIANTENLKFWVKLSIFGPAFIPVALLFFIKNYPFETKPFKPLTNLIIILPAIISALLLPGDLVVKEVYSFTNMEWGKGYFFFGLYMATYFTYVIYQLVKKIKTDNKKEKSQLLFSASGIAIAIIAGMYFDFILPILGNTKYISIGPLFSSFFTYFTLYAMLKYRFMNIEAAISKNIATLFTFTILATGLIASNWLYKGFVSKEITDTYISISTILFLFISSAIYPQLRLRLQSTTEKLFLKGQYDYKKALIKFTAELSECTDLDTMMATVQKNFEDEIEISNIDIFLPEGFTERKEIATKLVLQDQKKLIVKEENGKVETKIKSISREDLKINSISDTDTIYKTLIERSQPIAFIKEKNKDLTALFSKDKKHTLVPCFNAEHKLLCILTLGEKMTQDPYSDDDIDLLTTLAAQIPPVLERIHQARVSAEMDVAQRIQVEILPKEPEIKGMELSCYMSPADEVGGDYYDVYEMEKASWLVVGDVAGHGVGSGLVMFMVQSIMATLLQSQPDITPGELNYQANKILCKNFERLDEGRPMTLVTLRTTDSRTFSISGSHDNIYIYRKASKEIEAISVDHFPFGIGLTGDLERELFMEESFTLETGDLLFLGTDGITEAFKDGDDKAEQYGEDRLTDIIFKHHNDPVHDIRKALLDDLDSFSHGIYYDDVTFVIAKAV